MSNQDWNPDDFLNFDYGKEVPDQRHVYGGRASRNSDYEVRPQPEIQPQIKAQPKPQSQPVRSLEEEMALYEQLRQQNAEKSNKREQKKAQEAEYQKYRKKYGEGGKSSSSKNSKLNKFDKVLSILYLIELVIFLAVVFIMNILPFYLLIALIVVLGLLSFILTLQLRKNNVKRKVKIFATILAIVLMIFYGVGIVYSLGTLSFLDKTSVKNDNRVAFITRDPFNVCITGMDVWETIDVEGRSDVNMVVTVNPKTETILMTSIPRDYEVELPNHNYAVDKLTHTGFDGIDTTIQAEEELLDIDMNYYVKVNFATVVQFIDAIGGIDVENDTEFNSWIYEDLHYPVGKIHLNGTEALYFARERKAFALGDNKRIQNQQLVFEAMLKKGMSSKTMILSYSKILANLKDYFEMSFSSNEIRTLVRYQLARNPKWKIYKNTITGGDGHMGTYSTGSEEVYVMTQDPDSIENAQKLIHAVEAGDELTTDEDGNVKVVKKAEE